MELTETEKAYIAGLVDGEGCFFISQARGRYFQMKLIVGGTVHEHIRAVAKMAGVGTVHFQKKKPPNANQTQWHISSMAALGLIKQIMPYLILKKDQARLAVIFQEHLNNSPPYNNRHPIPWQVLEYRLRLANLLKDMKSNGKTWLDVEAELIDLPQSEYQQSPLMLT